MTGLKECGRLIAAGKWRQVRYHLVNRLRGIDLRSMTVDELGLSPSTAKQYSDSGGPVLDAVLRSLDIAPTDVVIDLGCGKGGALLTLARYPFGQLAGLDLSPALIPIARRNFEKMGIANVELRCCAAADFVDWDRFTFVYLYNPFPCGVMQAVITNISDSLGRKPRRMTIIYRTPACHDVIERSGIFRKVREFRHAAKPFFIYTNLLKSE